MDHDVLAGEIVARVGEVLGPVAWQWVGEHRQGVHVIVHAIAPQPERPYCTLFTTGGSSRAIAVPAGVDAPAHVEWTLCVSPTWFGKTPLHAATLPRRAWPLWLLREVAAFAHTHECFVGPYHTIANDAPPRPYNGTTRMCHALVAPPVLWPDELRRITLSDGREIAVMAPVPILESELELKLEIGGGALWRDLRSNGITEMIEPERAFAVQRRVDVDQDERSRYAALAEIPREAAYTLSVFPDSPAELCARATGAYTEMRLVPKAGEVVGLPHARTLLAAGAHAILRELWTFKADDELARRALRPTFASGAPEVTPVRSTIVDVLEASLAGLGIATDLRTPMPVARLLSSEDIRARSSGEVTLAETYDDDATFAPIANGLHCPAIFGTLDDADARRRRCGHIALAAPIVHPLFVYIVADIVEVPVDELARVPLDRVRTALRDFKTDGRVRPESLLVDALVVTPPATRPIVRLADGRFATSDHNDLYLDVIAANARVRANAADLDARAGLQRAANALMRNGDFRTNTVHGSRRLRSLHHALGEELRVTWRRVDFSASGPCVAHELSDAICAIPDALARALFATHDAAGAPRPTTVLVTPTAMTSGVQPIVACDIVIVPGGELELSPAVMDELDVFDGESVSIHVPITAAAIAEARTLLRPGRELAPCTVDVSAHWLGMAARDGLIDTLVRAVNAEEPDPVLDLPTRLLLARV